MNNMRFSDLFSLSKASFKGNKKLKKLVFGICVVLSILVLLMWFSLSYSDFNKKQSDLSYEFNVLYSKEGEKDYQYLNSTIGQKYLMSQSDVDKLIINNEKYITSQIRSSSIILQGDRIINVDGVETVGSEYQLTARFFDNEFNNYQYIGNNVNQNLINQTGVGVLSSGDGFSKDAKQEIIISENFMNNAKLNKSVLGKNISLKLKIKKQFASGCHLDNDNKIENQKLILDENYKSLSVFDGGEIEIFKDFKVVGIINNRHIENHNTLKQSDIWLPIACLDKLSMPIIRNERMYDNKKGPSVMTYTDTDYVNMANKSVADGMFFPFMINNGYIVDQVIPFSTLVTNELIEMNNSSAIKRVYIELNKFLTADFVVDESPQLKVIQNSALMQNINYILIAVILVVIVVLLLSYYNVMKSDAKNKQKYMNLMQTLGASRKDVIKLYVLEFLMVFTLIFLVTSIITTAFAFILPPIIENSLQAYIQNNVSLANLLINTNDFPFALLFVGIGFFSIGGILALTLSFDFKFKRTEG